MYFILSHEIELTRLLFCQIILSFVNVNEKLNRAIS